MIICANFILFIIFISNNLSTSVSEELYSDELPKPFSVVKLPHHKSRKMATVKKRPIVIEKTLNIAAKEGLNYANKIYNEIEPNILKNQQILEDNHPASLLSKFSEPTFDNTNITKSAYAALFATKAFRRRYFLNFIPNIENIKILFRGL